MPLHSLIARQCTTEIVASLPTGFDNTADGQRVGRKVSAILLEPDSLDVSQRHVASGAEQAPDLSADVAVVNS